MADEGYPSHPPVPPTPATLGTPPPMSPAGPTPPRRGQWPWIVAALALLVLLMAGCIVPFVLLFAAGEGPSAGADAVAVIRLDAVIAGTGDSVSGVVTPESFLDKLERAEEDDRVKAVVLRVDSPGGTVAASEEISAYVRTAKKPVVVSIGDVGASGAYMVASQADEIWANPGTAVGSIGVISQIPNVKELLGKVGVEFQVITAGKYKDVGSPYRPLSKEEKALIQGEVDEAYGQFIDLVAKGRGLPRAKVEELATGWVWSGVRAKELGLIDQLGTYRDALDAAADKGGIEGEYDVVTYDEEFGELLSSLMSLRSAFGILATSIDRESATRQALPR